MIKTATWMLFLVRLAQRCCCILFVTNCQNRRHICLRMIRRTVSVCCGYLRNCLAWSFWNQEMIVHICPDCIGILVVWCWSSQFLIWTLNLLQIHEHLSIPIYPLNCIRIGEVKFVDLLLCILGNIEILILVLLFPCCLILLLWIET